MYCATDGITLFSFRVRRLADRWVAQAPNARRLTAPAPGAIPADDEALRLVALDKMAGPRLFHLAPRVAALPPILPGSVWAWVARANVADVKAWAAELPEDGRLKVTIAPTIGDDDRTVIGWVAVVTVAPLWVFAVSRGDTMADAASDAEALGFDAYMDDVELAELHEAVDNL
jgi:hypothetical protein